MKKYIPLFFLAAVFAAGCKSNMDYDISEGFDKEMTLFENEISVPLGSMQPLTLALVLDKVYSTSIGAMLKDFIKVDADGLLYTDAADNVSSNSVYDLVKQIPDPSKEYQWTPYNMTASPGGGTFMFQFVGLPLMNQELTFSMVNPLYNSVELNADAVVSAGSYSDKKELRNFKLDSSEAVQLAKFSLGEVVNERIGSFGLENIKMNLPANITDNLRSKAHPMFVLSYQYKANIAAGKTLKFEEMSIPVKDLNLPVGQFGLSHLEVNVELENTLPFDVAVPFVQVIKPSDDDPDDFVEDENIEVETFIDIQGGSLEEPSPSSITLSINAKEGKIPDIYGFHLVANIKASEAHAQTLLSTKQGLTVKSADATLKGGITLFKYNKEGNDNE
ncbi:MAG: hypothetical protein IJU68_01870 [Bacteroidales bacterium]|nr:hypothetical protein [Bacteroidales bacterium]